MSKEITHRKFHAAFRRSRNDLQAANGITAQREVIVINADALQRKYLAPDSAENLFFQGPWLGIFSGFRSRLIRRRQGLAINFPIGGERKLLQPDICSRNHVLREIFGKMFPKLADGNGFLFVASGSHQVSD